MSDRPTEHRSPVQEVVGSRPDAARDGHPKMNQLSRGGWARKSYKYPERIVELSFTDSLPFVIERPDQLS